MVDSVSFSIIFTDTAHDTQPPKIMAIMANGLSAENFYTPAAAALLGVEAYDNGSGIDSLTIGGKRIMRKGFGHVVLRFNQFTAHNIGQQYRDTGNR